jgi:hypothetical protein
MRHQQKPPLPGFRTERTLSRRRFLRSAAGAAGLVLGAPFVLPTLARADEDDIVLPRPIPGGDPTFNPFTDELLHVYFPAVGLEPSSIFDFKGVVGAAIVDGTGTGMTRKRKKERLLFEVDLRFMQGDYRGVDGKRHSGTFALV